MNSQQTHQRSSWIGRFGLVTGRVILYTALLGPLAALILYAGSERWFFPQLWPEQWSGAPFVRMLVQPQTRDALLNGLVIAGGVTAVSLVIGLPAARTLGMRQFRGRTLVLLVLFLPQIVPPMATGMGLNTLFLRLGLAGSMFGVALVHLIPVLPYVIFSLIGVFARYDAGYEQQAHTLGASRRYVFRHVTLPLIMPGIVTAALFAFLVSWSQYLPTLLIGGGRVLTLPLLLFATVSGGNPASIAVVALLFAAPPLLAIILAVRMLAERTLSVAQQY